MSKLGSGDNGEFTFLDTISIISFLIGVQNLGMNITQEDVQEVETKFNSKLEESINDIHTHLAIQDDKLNMILERLGEMK